MPECIDKPLHCGSNVESIVVQKQHKGVKLQKLAPLLFPELLISERSTDDYWPIIVTATVPIICQGFVEDLSIISDFIRAIIDSFLKENLQRFKIKISATVLCISSHLSPF